jgi:hypothetical protein
MGGPAEAARYHAEQELAAHRAGSVQNGGSLEVEATEHFVHPKDLVFDDDLMTKVRVRITEQHCSGDTALHAILNGQ